MIRTLVAILALAFVYVSVPANANPDGVVTPADTIHPNIHTTLTNNPQANANPNDVNANGGQLHGIANVPGQAGINPGDDGTAGFANQLETVHGGIGAYNPNAD